MDIKKAVSLLLEWYPKGAGGRTAVKMKVLLGAEQVGIHEEKLEGLYSEGGIINPSQNRLPERHGSSHDIQTIRYRQ